MRKMCFYVLGLLFPIFYPATDVCAENYLIMTRSDGQTTVFSVNDNPRISFSDGNLNVKSATMDITVARSEVKAFRFADKLPTAIVGIENDNEAKALFKEGRMYLSGLAANEQVRVCNLSGRVVMATNANSLGAASVDVSSMQKGVYIVRAGKVSVKVVNDKNE